MENQAKLCKTSVKTRLHQKFVQCLATHLLYFNVFKLSKCSVQVFPSVIFIEFTLHDIYAV